MIKLRSTKLVEELQRRKNMVAGRRPAAKIIVPEELAWWYFQEFGTTGDYEIAAKNGETLRLPPTAEHPSPSFPKSVIHPGIAPKAYVREVLPEIEQMAAREMTKALVQSNYNPEAVQQALMDNIMPSALNTITESMAKALHQTRDAEYPGKLGTQEPSDVFKQNATIVDSGE